MNNTNFSPEDGVTSVGEPNDLSCPHCHATTRQQKLGKPKAGRQRYRCMVCKKTYTVELERESAPVNVAETTAAQLETEPMPDPLANDEEITAENPVPEQVTIEQMPIQQAAQEQAAAGQRVGEPDTREQAAMLPTGSDQTAITTDTEEALTPKQSRPVPAWRSAAEKAWSTAKTPFVKAKAPLASDPTLLTTTAQPVPELVVGAPVARTRRSFLRLAESAATANQWGWLPEMALLQAAGLLLLAWAFVAARASSGSANVLFWLGLAGMLLPVTYRLASVEPTRRERIGLILVLGMALYLVKIMHSPMAFTFPDELSHLRNVNEVLDTHQLLRENPILPATALYPGLASLTSTVISLSGLSVVSAGFLVIGIARLILFLSLFLLYEQVSGSARVASLATLFYMANPNFLYFTAEYAYESLALPLIVFVLLAAWKREMSTDRRHRIAWMVAAVVGILMVTITHHMSSYILTGFLVALTLVSGVRSRGKQWVQADLALVAIGAAALWLIFVANQTVAYLSPVLFGAIRSLFNMIAEEETGRQLFKSASTGAVAPLWEQVVGMGSVVVIALGLPPGTYEIWQKYRNKTFALLLAVIALGYLPFQLLRLTSKGWETANRSSEFLFIGVAFVLAVGIERFWLAKWSEWKRPLTLAALAMTLFFGGLIVGWPPKARLPRPYLVSSYQIKPQIVSVAEWMRDYLGKDNRMAASKADAKVIGAYGQYPYTGNAGGIKDMFFSDQVGPSERGILSKRNIQYIVSDRKMVSWDHMIGYYFFNQQTSPSWELEVIPPQIVEKFEGLNGVGRVLDSGDLIIYDVGTYLASPEQPSSATKTKSEAPDLTTLSEQGNAQLVPGDGAASSLASVGGRIVFSLPLARQTRSTTSQAVADDIWFSDQSNAMRIKLGMKRSIAGKLKNVEYGNGRMA